MKGESEAIASLLRSCLSGCLFELLLRFLLLHFAHLGKYNLAEDGALRNPAQATWALAGGTSSSAGGVFCRLQGLARCLVCDGLTGTLECVSGHICLARYCLFLVFLHLQSFDAIRKLDELDTALEASLCDVRTNLGQQVVIAGSLAAKPNVLQRLLCLVSPADRKSLALPYLTRGPLVLIRLEQLCNEVLGILADFLPIALMEDHTAVLAFLNQICEVLGSERRVTAKKSISDDTHGPHIDGLAMALLQHDFRRRISEGASHGGQHLVLGVEHLSDTKISQHKGGVSFACKVKKVLWLEICGK